MLQVHIQDFVLVGCSNEADGFKDGMDSSGLASGWWWLEESLEKTLCAL
jgi:hypothetical protein